ncbi:MAG: pirin family protein [Ignavibacteriae bacterium]|nr:pirin family protein [Ignavibacteriota bacterium]
MNKIFHPASERGFFDHGWLKTFHSFSFASWYSPQKIRFGKLRVLNDDWVAPAEGFGMHPHDNMEIVTILLKGSLAHKDSMGHQEIIKPNEIQVMSAGTGITHSEFNASENENVELLQIWVFPDKSGHTPRYDQKYFNPVERRNKLQTVVAPNKNENSLWLNQDAYLSWGEFEKDQVVNYQIHNSKNGVYIFVIEGIIKTADEILSRRDAIGIWNSEKLEISILENSFILLIEIPMN